MPEKNELTWWNVPAKWGKFIYSGTIAILIGLLFMQNHWLNTCQETRDQEKSLSDKRLEGWMNKLLDDKLKKVEESRINPKIDEAVKNVVDSIKTSS